MRKFGVSICLRVRLDGKQQYLRTVWLNRRSLKPLWAFVKGQPTEVAEGVYYLRFTYQGQRRWETVGADPAQALSLRKEREWQLNNMENIRNKPDFAKEDAPKPEPKSKKPTLETQKEKFLELKRLTKKQDGTRLDKETLLMLMFIRHPPSE